MPTDFDTWTETGSETGTLTQDELVVRASFGRGLPVPKGGGPSFTSVALPSVLEKRRDGAIVVRGHRITLFAILERLAERPSLAELCEAFPSLPVETIWSVLRFYSEHAAAVREYADEQREIAAENAGLFPYTGPTLEELRQRRNSRNCN